MVVERVNVQLEDIRLVHGVSLLRVRKPEIRIKLPVNILSVPGRSKEGLDCHVH
jgi:hypothetical protein